MFGAPKAVENSAQKALHTAIEIKEELYRFNMDHKPVIPLDIHVGINSGNVVAGTVGGKNKRDYTVMGDTVNVAARLEGASHTGQILAGPETYYATKNRFHFNALKPVALKGKSEPLPVYEPQPPSA